MKLRFTSGALADISEIADFIRAENPQAAEKVRASILESLQNLTLFPKAGRPQSVQGVRKLVTGKYRYLVYYLADDVEDEVVILAIQHPSRERPFRNE
jgi:plasmid stabilization system protein ParE